MSLDAPSPSFQRLTCGNHSKEHTRKFVWTRHLDAQLPSAVLRVKSSQCCFYFIHGLVCECIVQLTPSVCVAHAMKEQWIHTVYMKLVTELVASRLKESLKHYAKAFKNAWACNTNKCQLQRTPYSNSAFMSIIQFTGNCTAVVCSYAFWCQCFSLMATVCTRICISAYKAIKEQKIPFFVLATICQVLLVQMHQFYWCTKVLMPLAFNCLETCRISCRNNTPRVQLWHIDRAAERCQTTRRGERGHINVATHVLCCILRAVCMDTVLSDPATAARTGPFVLAILWASLACHVVLGGTFGHA